MTLCSNLFIFLQFILRLPMVARWRQEASGLEPPSSFKTIREKKYLYCNSRGKSHCFSRSLISSHAHSYTKQCGQRIAHSDQKDLSPTFTPGTIVKPYVNRWFKFRTRMGIYSKIRVPDSCLVTQLCLTFCNPVDGRQPGSSVRGTLQERRLEQMAIPFSRESS